jgi:hypothetical protein
MFVPVYRILPYVRDLPLDSEAKFCTHTQRQLDLQLNAFDV